MSEVMEPSAVALIEPTTNLALVFTGDGGVDAILTKIETDARALAADLDISTEKGRKEIASLARTKIARSKTALIDAGKKLTEDWRKQTAAVNADCRIIEARLDALRDEIRAPLTAWEQAEKDRVAAHDRAITDIEALASGLEGLTAEQIRERLKAPPLTEARNWQEFQQRASRTILSTGAILKVALRDAEQRAAEAAERAAREAQEAEERRLAALEAQRIREEQIAAHAAEKARQEAEAKAEMERLAAHAKAEADRRAAEAKAEAERQAIEARAREEREELERKAEAERQAAAKREQDARDAAAKAEADRLAAEAKAEAERKAIERRAEDDRLEAEAQARIERLRSEQREKDARDAQVRAEAAAKKAEADRIAAEERAERERQAAAAAQQKREAEAAARAEAEKAAAIEAERARAAAAAEAERAEAERRAANVAHRKRINNAVLAALVEHAGLSDAAGKAAIEAIARGLIPNVSIAY